MTSVRRRRPAGGHSTQATDPAAGSRRFHAALLGELPRLRRYAAAWLGNAAAADALVQDAMERLVAQGDAPDEPQHLRVRLLGLLHGLHQGSATLRRDDGPTGLDSLIRDLQTSVGRGERARMQELIGAIEQLSDDHRQALLLIALEGLSYREAADVLGLPLGTVMSRLSGAREELLALTADGDARDANDPSRSDNGGVHARSGVSELDLHAYLDGELGADRAKALKALLDSRPEQAERLERFAERDEMVRRLYAPLLNRPVPPELLAPLVAATPHPIQRRRWPQLATTAAAVALLLLGVAAGWLVRSYFTPAALIVPWVGR